MDDRNKEVIAAAYAALEEGHDYPVSSLTMVARDESRVAMYFSRLEGWLIYNVSRNRWGSTVHRDEAALARQGFGQA